jgi:hypothetical protein
MLTMKFNNIILVFIFTFLISSCSKKPDIEYTSTYKMSSEWYIKFYVGATAVTGYEKIISYNTSDPNSNQVWVDDLGLQPFKAKFDVDYASLTFKPATAVPNAASTTGKTIKVIEGKVLPGMGHSKSGVIVDSIYLKLEFSEEAGTIYEIKGQQRTGYNEDEY